MCFPAVAAAMATVGSAVGSALGLGATTATGAGALAGAVQTIGTVASVGGAVVEGMQGAAASREQVQVLKDQAKTEAKLASVTDQRQRSQFRSQISQQRAELVARGVTLDSPTAIALGRTAAAEMSFQSQATRGAAVARQVELTAAERAARMQGAMYRLRGFASAADSLLTAAPDLWPGMTK